MRIVTLLPAATEIVAAVGGEHLLVGISHACDWPPSVAALPRVTSTPDGRAIVVDAGRLRDLAPDLIITQNLCEVCAVDEGRARRVAEVLDPPPRFLTLEARTLEGIFEDIVRVGEALDLSPEAEEVIAGMRYRLTRLRRDAPDPPPRVVAIEWLDPIYLAGHWVPDLVEAAGGVDVGARSGEHSRPVRPEELAPLDPDVVVLMLCGLSMDEARDQLARFPLPELGVPVRVMDGNAHTSRAGPRVVDGAEEIRRALTLSLPTAPPHSRPDRPPSP
jgi:iron complex transport system substrate-binding protein